MKYRSLNLSRPFGGKKIGQSPASPSALPSAVVSFQAFHIPEEGTSVPRQQKKLHPTVPSVESSSLRSTSATINKKVDPSETLREGEAAYQKHKKTWDREYAGKFIAIHDGKVVAADCEKGRLLEKLIKIQQQEGRFRAYIVQVGASVIEIKGPHPSQRGRRITSN